MFSWPGWYLLFREYRYFGNHFLIAKRLCKKSYSQNIYHKVNMTLAKETPFFILLFDPNR